MKPQSQSALCSISALTSNSAVVVESKGLNIIQTAINFISYIHSEYDTETAQMLERKFINSIKLKDSRKYTRAVKRIGENKDV